MKKYCLNVVLAAVVAVSLLSGCASTPSPATIARMATLAQLAAYDGTTLDLMTNPTHKPAYQGAVVALDALLNANNFDPVAFAAALQSLPIKELQGQQGSLIINNAIILWQGYAAETVNLDKTVYIKPVMEAVRAGLARAIK